MQTLITKHYAGLFNGMSQQAPTLRLETQGNYQENAISSLVYGLCQRPPVSIISSGLGYAKPFWHTINRDEDERYIIKLDAKGDLKVMNLKGFEYPVEGVTQHQNYITTKSPQNDIAMTTIGDYTFIVNKRRVVRMKQVVDSFTSNSDMSAMVKLSINARLDMTHTYYIKVDGVTLATYTHVDGKRRDTGEAETLDDIAQELRDQINARTGFSATQPNIPFENGRPTFYFRKVDGTAFTLEVDGWMEQSISGGNTTSLSEYDKRAIIYVSKGVAEQNYRVVLTKRGTTVNASYQSGNTNQGSTYRTETIAANLASQINAGAGGIFETSLNGAVIEVWAKDKSDFTIEVGDSWGDAALKAFKGRAQAFNALPPKAPDGFVLQIVGKTDSDEGTYWVRYEKSYLKEGKKIASTGVWKEYREPNGYHKFDNSTMPLQLIRKQDIARYRSENNPLGLYFALEYCLWSDRAVGDENSNPNPSFVDNTINDIFLFSNRLGILSGQSVSLTKVGDFFNFFAGTVTDALDDAPIDVDVPSTSVTTLYYAKASRDNLMIFGDDQQFILNSGNDPLSSKTINVAPILSYPFDGSVRPVSLGQMTYFISPRGNGVSLREYFIQNDGMINDAPSVTDHVPDLLKSSSNYLVTGMPNEDILFVSDYSSKLYVYKYSWSGDKKTQSSWSVWTFAKSVAGIFCFDNKLYIAFGDGVLGKIDLGLVGSDYECVDFDKPFSAMKEDARELLVTPNVIMRKYYDGSEITSSITQNDLQNAIAGGLHYGYKYSFKYHFSPIFLKFTNDVVGSIDGRTLLRRATIYLAKAANVYVSIRDYSFDKEKLRYFWDNLTSTARPSIYKKTFILRGEAKDNKLCIESAGIKPIYIQSVSFEILTSLIDKPL
jgi:tail tubular protein B